MRVKQICCWKREGIMFLLVKRFWQSVAVLVAGALASLSFAQTGPSWAKIYGTNAGAAEVLPTPDGGFIAAGWKRVPPFGLFDTDMWVVKLDASGNPTSQRTYGGTGRDEIYTLQLTSDGGYIAAGLSTSFGAPGHAPLVLKFDSLGNIQWQRTYMVRGRDWANAVKQTSDGGYVIVGASDLTYGGPGNERAAVIKLDASGSIQWQKTYGRGIDCENASDILQTPDGGYIVAAVTGQTNPACWTGAGAEDIWLIKLDSNGSIQWQKTYGGTRNDRPGSIRPTADGGWIVAGISNSFGAGGDDAWVLKLNSDGTVAWQKAYGGTRDDGAYYAEQTSDGGYIVSGYTATFGVTGSDLWVFKLDPAGNIVWQRSYDSGSPAEVARKIHETADGGYVVAGYDDLGCSRCNFTILKLRLDGSVDPSCPAAIGQVTSATAQNTSAVVLNATAGATPGPFNANTTNVTITGTSAQANTICSSPESRQTVFLIHGIDQRGGEEGRLHEFAASLRAALDPSRFIVDAGFDWHQCSVDCLSGCTLDGTEERPPDRTWQIGPRALAEYIRGRQPVGEIILVGYSMGGLIARDLALNHLTNYPIAALITLGTPHLGYPYQVGNGFFTCGTLAEQMFGDFRNRPLFPGEYELTDGQDRRVTVSRYLHALNERWRLTPADQLPPRWFAAAGTSCPTPVRFFSISCLELGICRGCSNAIPRNDGIVCEQSATFGWSVANAPCPTCRWGDLRHTYAHTDLEVPLFCEGILGYPLWNPGTDPDWELIEQIRTWIEDLP